MTDQQAKDVSIRTTRVCERRTADGSWFPVAVRDMVPGDVVRYRQPKYKDKLMVVDSYPMLVPNDESPDGMSWSVETKDP